MTQEWHEMTALALGAAIESGAIDPVALCDHFLDRIETQDGDHTVYIQATGTRARAEAAAASARAKSSLRRSPLDGVPISWKDLYDSAGTATTGGSPLLKDRVPQADAAVLARATRAGLVCLGKTTMTELAYSGLGINPSMGTPINPYDSQTARAPGGSSSGAAVSVARGLAAAGIGSDTGGSVRIPAAWQSLVGLKTTPGAIPLAGVLPLWPGVDTVGPLTRDIADAAALFAVLSARPSADLAGANLQGRKF
ncbi:MAG: amidase family protein, partial [Proteobacteria bacterium]|nr:amidase family protein [Pseudomonadota bacterium]